MVEDAEKLARIRSEFQAGYPGNWHLTAWGEWFVDGSAQWIHARALLTDENQWRWWIMVGSQIVKGGLASNPEEVGKALRPAFEILNEAALALEKLD